MQKHGYEVRVPEGTEQDGGYIAIAHGTVYTLSLANRNATKCEAKVEVDGKHIGTWIMHPNDVLPLERPAHDTGRFTAYNLNTPEGAAAALQSGDKLGLISVTFTPEKPQVCLAATSFPFDSYPTRGGGESRSFSLPTFGGSLSPMGTGLSGRSSQEFTTVPELDKDFSKAVTINLRIGGVAPAVQDGPRPLTAVDMSTPVPASLCR